MRAKRLADRYGGDFYINFNLLPMQITDWFKNKNRIAKRQISKQSDGA
jgi:hypothetical protein